MSNQHDLTNAPNVIIASKPVATQKLSILDFLKADMTDTGLYTLM
jgi:hypothetical protein